MFRKLLQHSLQCLLKALYKVEVRGIEHYREAGNRVLIVANHTSFLDAMLLVVFLPDKLTFAINTFIANRWWIKPFLKLVEAHPIDPTSPMATKDMIELLRQNRRCVIFPEGRITVTGSLMKIYEGPGMIADKSGATILPVRIDGAQFTPFSRLRGKVRIRLFPKITLTILPSHRVDVPQDIKGRRRRHISSAKLYDIMTDMLFESSNIHQTLFQSLLDALAMNGSRHVAVTDVERKAVTYRQFVARSFILGREIAKITKRGEYVGVFLPNMNNTAITFFALHAFGRVPAMINYSTGVKNVVSACHTAQLRTVYTSRRFIEAGKLEEMADAIKAAGVKLIYLEDVRPNITFLDKLRGIAASYMPHCYYKKITPFPEEKEAEEANKPGVILFTSGTEGTPKGVVLSHANIQANRCQLAACVDFGPHDLVFNALPLFHSFGLTAGTLLPLLSGIKVFFYPSPLHYRIVPELVYDTNATILFGTDTFLSGYARYAHAYDFYSVRYVFAGAEKLKEGTRRIWSEKFGVRVLEGYGATETAPVIAANTPMHNKAGTVGRLMPGIDFHLEKVPGIEEGGKLIVHGPNVMLGYLKADNPGVLVPPHYAFIAPPLRGSGRTASEPWGEFPNLISNSKQEGQQSPHASAATSSLASAAPPQGGSNTATSHQPLATSPNYWYDTGDIVDISEEGYVTILGRAKRFAKIGGEMISLGAVENSISALWPDYHHAVIAIADEKKGEQLVLVTEHAGATREDILQYFKAQGISELSLPRQIKVVDKLPLLGSGKIDYQAVNRLVKGENTGD